MMAVSARLAPLLLAAATFVSVDVHPGQVTGTEPAVAGLYVRDALVAPKQPADIEAFLLHQLKRGETPAGGVPLELVLGEKVVAAATTDESGRATFHYTPARRGVERLVVRPAAGSGVTASAVVNVAAWERRTPLLVVELAALVDPQSKEALPDAAEELGRLTQFYYSVMYLAAEGGSEGDAWRVSNRARQWLAAQGFPAGYVLVVPSAPGDWGIRIDELRSAGWTTVKVGVGRSNAFAEMFLQRRLDVVLVPDPGKGTAPKKAKVAKDWKDVRRKL